MFEQSIKEYFKQKKKEYKEIVDNLSSPIKLLIIKVGDNAASERYVNNKIKDMNDIGIEVELREFPESVNPDNVYNSIRDANLDITITGIMVQLPLPPQLDAVTIADLIRPDKDVDGFNVLSGIDPCTPRGMIDWLEDNNYDFVNKNAVIIGRSDIVGRPMAKLLLDRSCNVTTLHSKTSYSNLVNYLAHADLVIVATGHRNTISDEDLSNNSDVPDMILDVGINFTEENKMIGDCENITKCPKTPVPGGVGLLTRLAVMSNLIALKKRTRYGK